MTNIEENTITVKLDATELIEVLKEVQLDIKVLEQNITSLLAKNTEVILDSKKVSSEVEKIVLNKARERMK